MKRILALPQNETHAETVNVLAPSLFARGCQVSVLSLEGVFHQPLAIDRSGGVEVISAGIWSDQPFYSLGRTRQLAVVSRSAASIRRLVARPDILLAFNDGSLQRVALRHAQKVGIRTVLLLDGMISRYRRPSRAAMIRRLGRQLATTPLAPFLPSDVGLSAVDALLVIGEHSAAVLREQGSGAREVIPTGLPRFPAETSHDPPTRVRRILYLTGAFGWHRHGEMDRAQVADVGALAAVAARLNIELIVRVHPRDTLERYGGMENVTVTRAISPLRDQVMSADVVCSLVSTGLLEAVALGRVAMSVCLTPDWKLFERSFVADPAWGRYRSAEALRDALASLDRETYAASQRQQRAAYRHYVAAGGDEAVANVVEAILA